MSSNPPNHLTPEERARLRELASKATPAPWRWAVERHAVLRLLDEIERRPPPLVWSKEPPSEPGLYWYKSKLTGELYANHIDCFRLSRGLRVYRLAEWSDGGVTHVHVVDVDEYEWAGPIPQPSEASE